MPKNVSYTRMKEREALGLEPDPNKLKRKKRRYFPRPKKRERMRQLRKEKRLHELKMAREVAKMANRPGPKVTLPPGALDKIDNLPLKRFMDTKRQASETPAGTIEHLLQLSGATRDEFVEVINRACYEHEPAALKFQLGWVRLSPSEKLEINLDAFCRLIGLRPSALIGLFVEHMCRLKQQAALLRAAMALDNVVQATVDFAQEREGIEDRKIILKNQKFIQDAAQGPQVVVDQRKQVLVSGGERSFEQIIRGEAPVALPPGEVIDAVEDTPIDAEMQNSEALIPVKGDRL